MDDEKKALASVTSTALTPAAQVFSQTTGQAGEKFGQAFNLVADNALVLSKTLDSLLAPLRLWVYGYEQIRSKLGPLVTERIQHIPHDRIQPPPLLIAGPIAEAAKFSMEEPSLADLFANLLASAMDKAHAHKAHPSFVEAIKQMSPDDAVLIKEISKYPDASFPLVDFASVKEVGERILSLYNYCDIFAKPHEKMRGSIQVAIENLARLGIIEISKDPLADERYEKLTSNPEIQLFMEANKAIGRNMVVRKKRLSVPLYGIEFINTCVLRFGEVKWGDASRAE